jgi:Hint domain
MAVLDMNDINGDGSYSTYYNQVPDTIVSVTDGMGGSTDVTFTNTTTGSQAFFYQPYVYDATYTALDGLSSDHGDDTATFEFSNSVENLTFDVYGLIYSSMPQEVNAGKITVTAYDAIGNPVPVTFTYPMDGSYAIGTDGDGYWIEATDSAIPVISVGVNVAGPIAVLVIETGLSSHAVNSTTSISIDDLFFDIAMPMPCFVAGTLIKTEFGEVPVENLKVGDRVMTRDHGLRPIRWTGTVKTAGNGRNAPIMIKKGTLGNEHDLLVSPQHRMLLVGIHAELLTGDSEVLAAAIHLCNGDTIYVHKTETVRYVHFMFDEHEIVYANGSLSESFYPGDIALDSVDMLAQEEILRLFPELRDRAARKSRLARMVAKKHVAKLLSPLQMKTLTVTA